MLVGERCQLGQTTVIVSSLSQTVCCELRNADAMSTLVRLFIASVVHPRYILYIVLFIQLPLDFVIVTSESICLIN